MPEILSQDGGELWKAPEHRRDTTSPRFGGSTPVGTHRIDSRGRSRRPLQHPGEGRGE